MSSKYKSLLKIIKKKTGFTWNPQPLRQIIYQYLGQEQHEGNWTWRDLWNLFPAGIYLLKVNNRNGKRRCEICSKLTIHKTDAIGGRHYGVLITPVSWYWEIITCDKPIRLLEMRILQETLCIKLKWVKSLWLAVLTSNITKSPKY